MINWFQARQVPMCLIHLGDRPIHITLQRALASLSWWQTIRLMWHLVMSKEPIRYECLYSWTLSLYREYLQLIGILNKVKRNVLCGGRPCYNGYICLLLIIVEFREFNIETHPAFIDCKKEFKDAYRSKYCTRSTDYGNTGRNYTQ